jgi:ParB-like nuclease domain
MIKQGRHLDHLTAADLDSAVDPHPPAWCIEGSRAHGYVMVQNLLLYVAVWAMMFALFWLAGRLLGLKRPVSGPTGRPWLDAEDAFDRARRQHQRHQLAAALRGQPHRLELPTLKQATTLGLGGSRNPGELEIPIRDIVGAVDGAAGKFDRDFLPTDERSRWRFQEIVVALRAGETLPPIEVYRLHGRYYIADGHHRVAASRALGEKSIAAYVTEIFG